MSVLKYINQKKYLIYEALYVALIYNYSRNASKDSNKVFYIFRLVFQMFLLPKMFNNSLTFFLFLQLHHLILRLYHLTFIFGFLIFPYLIKIIKFICEQDLYCAKTL